MTDSKKLDFYLRHRELIEEWAAIRDEAASELDHALESATSILFEEGLPDVGFIVKYSGRGVRIPVSPGVEMLLWWKQDQLFRARGDRRLPILAVHTPKGKKFPGRLRVMDATRHARLIHGMPKEGVQWVWKGNIIPQEPLLELEGYAQSCILKLRDAWQDLHGPIRDALAETRSPGEDSTTDVGGLTARDISQDREPYPGLSAHPE